jgi:hypothetical protein
MLTPVLEIVRFDELDPDPEPIDSSDPIIERIAAPVPEEKEIEGAPPVMILFA